MHRHVAERTKEDARILSGICGVDYDSNEQVYSVSFAPLGRVSLRLGSTNLFDDEAGINPIAILLKADPGPFESYGFIVFDGIGIAVTGYHDSAEAQRAITVYRNGSWRLEHAKPMSERPLITAILPRLSSSPHAMAHAQHQII